MAFLTHKTPITYADNVVFARHDDDVGGTRTVSLARSTPVSLHLDLLSAFLGHQKMLRRRGAHHLILLQLTDILNLCVAKCVYKNGLKQLARWRHQALYIPLFPVLNDTQHNT